MKLSWLQNPAVALIELLASVIAVLQSAAWLCRYIGRLARAEGGQYRRVRIAGAAAALAVVAAFAVVTWPVIIALAAKGGDHGFMGAMYPLQFDGLAFIGAWTMLGEARARQPFSPVSCCMLVITLATVAVASAFRTGSTAWVGVSLTDSAPTLAMVVVLWSVFRGPFSRAPARGRNAG
jgi:hypothetical protein